MASKISSAKQLNNMLTNIRSRNDNESISNMQQLIHMFENSDISSFDKLRIFYKNADKIKLSNLSIKEIKKNIYFIVAICYNVLNGKYSNLLNNIIIDKNKIINNEECKTKDMVGFNQFYELIAVTQVEMAIYNIDHNDHTYKFNDIEDILTMNDVIKMRYDAFISEVENHFTQE